jgi:hypothetical protein
MRPKRAATSRGLRPAFALIVLALLPCVAMRSARGAYHGPDNIDPLQTAGRGIFALKGEFVHNVGELQLNITNWGLIGSRPSLQAPYSDAPSAMWPAGSGVDYLWAAGLWIGALKNGIPAVTEGQYRTELVANGDDPLDTIYESHQGEPGGKHYPDNGEDDDGDGLVNEDPKNGVDDDGDGKIDEDFAAIGNQEFRCAMRDNTALIIELRPDHQPLDIQIVQESYQWENDAVDDFVGFQFTLSNIGVNPLSDVYVGLFADCDIGPRGTAGISDDDLPGFWRGGVLAKDGSLVPISVAYMYDADGDNGQSMGYIGLLFLNHPTDPLGEHAPKSVGITSFQQFSGQQPFDRGGDPTNDAEAYELLSRKEFDQFPTDAGKAADFRIMMSSGPFTPIDPGATLVFQMAMVVGPGLDGLQRNAAEAALTYYGAYFDRDANSNTGVKGRETKICQSTFGPPGPTNPIFSLFQDCVDSMDFSGPTPPVPIKPGDLDADGCIYINGDCPFEKARNALQCTLDGTGVDEGVLAGCTGVLGKEFNVAWLVGLAPPAPDLRLWETADRVHLFWNNISETTKDLRLQKIDFESYRIWRADGWNRPFGSSVANGPESRLWRLIGEYDKVDSFELRRILPSGLLFVQKLPLGPNTGLDPIHYVPWVLRPGSPEQQQYAELDALVTQIVAENPGLGPLQNIKVRYLDDLGHVSDYGKLYPALAQWSCCYTQLDTLFWNKKGVAFYEFIDRDVHNGIFYFHSVTATDFTADPVGATLVPIGPGLSGDPASNFKFSVPKSQAQTAEERAKYGANVYLVPNPATRSTLADFSELNPNASDPTGVRVEFRNLPRAQSTVRIFTLAGDLVIELAHDGTGGDGSLPWNLVSRNGQEIVSGIYLYSVQSDDPKFDRVVGRFVVVR